MNAQSSAIDPPDTLYIGLSHYLMLTLVRPHTPGSRPPSEDAVMEGLMRDHKEYERKPKVYIMAHGLTDAPAISSIHHGLNRNDPNPTTNRARSESR